ncbi:LapA family protein [Tetragenococcus koreensis]|uniref:Lipopolysaccharide assembly protein A domain-containing protein n=1 Tax=Tetragenococcus koreensis TaxID=290335 RepID=A0AAN4UAE4_9ENTE|nr:LapA family protein [Tetragenococcus koreensis]MCF1585502.1 LapA family protein [Tetragenococcus koreensis]MCF1615069.1 LapA family protein [Tetragenococcus koreensis]MCF1616410.1 LapA family protein [Tetragenococcus koreensis]MCF1619208.1 LapA family protein [Tetragenococcus koreensis]MCF1621073.1 LapA family protein [Tetragenococcus koreensis]
MKNQWRIILGLVLTLLIVLFAVMNNMDVPINFGFSQLSAPLVIIIIGSAFLGAVVIALVATSTIWQQRKEIKKLNKQLGELEQSLDQKVADKRQELERQYNNKLAALETDNQLTENQQEETNEEDPVSKNE